jgi:ribosomal protein RSM22 (predicted rRNA methylase)
MQMPASLRRAIEHHAQGHSISSLAQAAARISSAYRGTLGALPSDAVAAKSPGLQVEKISPAISTEIERLAYVVTRMPATYAAAHAVLTEIHERMPDASVETVLDLGAGPGTASWVAGDVFPMAREFELLERDRAFADLGKSLAAESESSALQLATWKNTDIGGAKSLSPHDLVIFAYSIGEVKASETPKLLDAAWTATRKVLAIIEPGTTAGFARIRLLRDELLRLGGHLLAPCPHQGACPMSGDDWCHFAARVERSSLHRRVKGGTLGFEDEKYSYIVMSKAPARLAHARIIRRPVHHTGFTELRLCTAEGLRDITVSRKHKAEFRLAKKSIWGSAWEFGGGRTL